MVVNIPEIWALPPSGGWLSAIAPATIPKGVVSIGEGAFENSTGLASVTIPDTLESIGDAAFVGCSSLISGRRDFHRYGGVYWVRMFIMGRVKFFRQPKALFRQSEKENRALFKNREVKSFGQNVDIFPAFGFTAGSTAGDHAGISTGRL